MSTLQKTQEGRVVIVKRNNPNEYKKCTTPLKSKKRLQVNNEIPKSLTPKGYTKMQLILSIAGKQYDSTVKRLKGSGKLFEDSKFPADSTSLGNISGLPQIAWLRPKEIISNSEFIVGGFNRDDVNQGMLGDCWLLAVIASMADIKPMFEHCVPPNQIIQSENYVGIFKFRFWRFGNWVEVLIDDRLPVDARTKKLIFMHSDQSNEMWSALMEKAYAKLNGSYANLSGGSQAEAMEDITGGLAESIDLTKMDVKLLSKDLLKYEKRCCLMGCSVETKSVEEKLSNGLIGGHAYSVTGVFPIKLPNKDQILVRVRNPWGNNYEWTGPWADNSKEWNAVSREVKQKLDVDFNGDGEFWMAVEDFNSSFTKLEICHLGHGSLEADTKIRGKTRLEESVFTGEWTPNISAGGCPNYQESFWTNPQFRFTAVDSDPTDDDEEATVTIGLMQKDGRRLRGANFLTIGFVVYAVDGKDTQLKRRGFFTTNSPLKVSSFTNSREVVLRIKVKPGTYMVVPCTFKPNEECAFILRIFSERPIKEAESDDMNKLKGISTAKVEAIKKDDDIKIEDVAVDDLFNKTMDPNRKSINAAQLCKLLNKTSIKSLCADSKGFAIETARSMLAAMDDNQTGNMEYEEFKTLWNKFQCWKKIFISRDKDKSKNLNAIELREALEDAGFLVSNKVFSACINRYVDQVTRSVSFEDWLLVCTRLTNAYENAEAQSKSNDSHLLFSPDDFLRLSIYQ